MINDPIIKILKEKFQNQSPDVDEVIDLLKKEGLVKTNEDCLYYAAEFLNIRLNQFEITQRWIIKARNEEEAKEFFADSSWSFSEDVIINELN